MASRGTCGSHHPGVPGCHRFPSSDTPIVPCQEPAPAVTSRKKASESLRLADQEGTGPGPRGLPEGPAQSRVALARIQTQRGVNPASTAFCHAGLIGRAWCPRNQDGQPELRGTGWSSSFQRPGPNGACSLGDDQGVTDSAWTASSTASRLSSPPAPTRPRLTPPTSRILGKRCCHFALIDQDHGRPGPARRHPASPGWAPASTSPGTSWRRP
jgi:hypothetical protein